jgi:nucleotide-binding universal stress UspA family protein
MLILVPVDGSAAAQRALTYALWLVHDRPKAAIVLLNVQTRDMIGLSDIDVQTETEREMASRNFARATRSAIKVCKNAGVRFQVRTEIGPICETIDRVAREVRADQIVMGTRGLGRLGGLLLGSIATGVIHMVQIPVTLVKSGSHARGVTDIALDRSTLHPS